MSPQQQDRPNDAHGRGAERPGDIPRPGWKDVLFRVKDDISRNNISLLAAGEAFYAFLAIPSAITAVVSLYGLMSNPEDVQRQVQVLQGVMPTEAINLISGQLHKLVGHSNETLGLGFIISILVALWSAQSGTSSMMKALDIAYEEPEKRGLLRFYATAFALTVATVVFAVAALALIAVLPAALNLLPFGQFGKTFAALVRWPVLLIMVMLVLAVIYRYAPSRRQPRWRWVSWGAVAAAILWIVGSVLFSIYVTHFAHYDRSYGSLGAVVVLLLWLYLSSYSVLLGAELNAEIEHQTARDSTIDGNKPMGQRGARMADTLGKEH